MIGVYIQNRVYENHKLSAAFTPMNKTPHASSFIITSFFGNRRWGTLYDSFDFASELLFKWMNMYYNFA